MTAEEILEKAKKFPTKIFSRVNGWYTSIDAWNPGKLSEWRDRKTYKHE